MGTPSQINDRSHLRLVKRRDTATLDRLERHLRGLRDHLDAIGMRAEAAAVRHELDMLTAIQ